MKVLGQLQQEFLQFRDGKTIVSLDRLWEKTESNSSNGNFHGILNLAVGGVSQRKGVRACSTADKKSGNKNEDESKHVLMVRVESMESKHPKESIRKMPANFDVCVARAAGLCEETARRWADRLSSAERDVLVLAFYRAESLAEYALEDAVEQLDECYRKDLIRQGVEEEKHVAVFAGFLSGNPPPVLRPKSKVRPRSVWFALLLLNELTGYCQFSMLKPLLETPEARMLLEEVMKEEEEHIERLLRWMEPEWTGRGKHQVEKMVSRFQQALMGRMEQFFEGAELADLRREMGSHVSGLLDDLNTRFLV